MKATIVIPSYWGRANGQPHQDGDAVYDHPTTLDSEGTLERALKSVCSLNNRDYNVVVIAAATSDEIAKTAEEKVREICTRFRGIFPVTCVSHTFEERIKARIDEVATTDPSLDSRMVSLRGYSNIRNMCLILTELARSEISVLFDDDEVYEDPGYLDMVFEDMERDFNGKPIRALAGYYKREDGGYLLPPPPWYYAEWPMVETMNAAFNKFVGQPPRHTITPFVFGGNMCLHRDVFRKIAFDPNVRRGEDIDYLINCRFFDVDLVLDNQLAVLHLPPKSVTPPWMAFRENVYRFVYEREKLRWQRPAAGTRVVKVEELDPYPGSCLRGDLEDHIYKTSVLMGLHYMHQAADRDAHLQATMSSFMSKGMNVGFEESVKNPLIARFEAKPAFDPYDWYLKYREKWEKLMGFLSTDETLSGELLEGMR